MLRIAAAADAAEDSPISPVRAGAAAVAGSSPFWGYIGQKPILHDPTTVPAARKGAIAFKSLEEAQAHAQPTDIIMTTADRGKIQPMVEGVTGMRFHHSQPVVGRNADGVVTSYQSKDFQRKDLGGKAPSEVAQTMVDHLADPTSGMPYKDILLLRRKTPLTPAQEAAWRASMDARVQQGYDLGAGGKLLLRDMFVPKHEGLAASNVPTVCEGNICSTAETMAMHDAIGRGPGLGKAPQHLVPPDYLRNPDYYLAGYHLSPEALAERSALRKAAPYLTRAAIGAGMAGATYAAPDHPELVGAAAAAGSTGLVLDAALSHNPQLAEKMPDWRRVLSESVSGSKPHFRDAAKRFATTRLPITLGAGALTYAGLNKLRGDRDKTAEITAGDAAQAAAVTAAGAAPFAGLIGQPKLQHDPLQNPKGLQFSSLEEAQRHARPGDYIATTKSKSDMFKRILAPLGKSQFYHIQPIVENADGEAATYQAGDFASDTHFRSLRPGERPRDLAETLPKYMADADNYDGVVLLRPKTPRTPEQAAKYFDALDKRVMEPYDLYKGNNSWFRDMFVPKIKGLTDKGPDVRCDGNVCSTMPAMAEFEATGKRIVDEVPAMHTFPHHFLRSDDLDVVGSYLSPQLKEVEGRLSTKAAPYLLRGGLGLAGAGATYAATEDPGVAAAGAAALAVPAAASYAGALPSLKEVVRDNVALSHTRDPRVGRHALLHAGKRLPIALGAGALAFGAERKLESLLDA